jgi:hypothetical protein
MGFTAILGIPPGTYGGVCAPQPCGLGDYLSQVKNPLDNLFL